MKIKTTTQLTAFCFFAFIVFLPTISSAQIIRDGTVGPGVEVQPNVHENSDGTTTIEIRQDHGELIKDNLFHSFKEFSILEKHIADFTTNFPSSAESPIKNVISRVTGGDPSNILGTLRSSIPDANFWLLNPNGVFFGKDAQIDVQGVFHAGAADKIDFQESGTLTASTSFEQILKLSNPKDFGFFKDSTANLTLTVEGSTLALNKGVSLSGADVGVTSATIAPAVVVGVVEQGGPIRLLASKTLTISDSVLETNIDGLGSIFLNGAEIDVASSAIKTSTDTFLVEIPDSSDTSFTTLAVENKKGGDITVSAENSAQFSSTTIATQTSGEGGDGGDILIQAPELKILNTSKFATNTSSKEGDGGNITIVSDKSVTLLGKPDGSDPSTIETVSIGNRSGGDISIQTPVLNLDAESTILSETRSYGTGGDISLYGGDAFSLFGGTVQSNVSKDARGKGGNIRIGFIQDIEEPKIIASTVTVGEGATVVSSTEYEGTCDDCGSKIGKGGDIEIGAVDSIDLTGTNVETTTTGTADGGNILVRATSVTIDEQTKLLSFTTLFEGNEGEVGNSYGIHGGQGGGILVDAGSKFVLSDSTIETETTQDGRGGYVTILSHDVLLENESTIQSKATNHGQGGNITVLPCEDCEFKNFRFNIKDGSVIQVEGLDGEYAGRINVFGYESFGGKVSQQDIVFGDPLDPLDGATEFNFGPGGIVLDADYQPEEAPVQLSGPNFIIEVERGVLQDGNLFHFFTEFNLNSGESATFAKSGKGSFKNVISQVTGDHASSIDGAIILEDLKANFFFINRNGVFFGPNATIDTSAAFYIAAAQPMNFPEPPEVESVSDETTSLLRVSSPSFFGKATAPVRISGSQLESPRHLGIVGSEVQIISNAELTGHSFGNSRSIAIYANELFTLSASKLTGNVTDEGETSLSATRGAIRVRAPEVQLLNESKITSAGGVDIGYSGAEGDNSQFTIQDGTILSAESSSESSTSVQVSGFEQIQSVKLTRLPVLPLLTDDNASLDLAESLNITIDVIGNDSGAAPESIAIASQPSKGTVTVNKETLAVVYTPTPDFIGVDTFTYTSTSTDGTSATQASVTVKVTSTEVDIDKDDITVEKPIEEDINFALQVNVFDQSYNHIKTSCKIRQPDGVKGGFRIVKRRGLPASPEDLLMAYNPDIMNAGSALELASLPEGAQPQLAEQFDTDATQVDSAKALTEGKRAFRSGNYDKASQAWAKASRLYAALGNPAARGDALRKLAETQQVQGNFVESIGTLQEALTIAKETKDRVQVASLLTSLGNANIALGDSKAAKDLLTRGLKLAQQTKQPALVTTSLNNLGNLYSTEGEYLRAIQVYEQSAKTAKASNQNVQFVKALSNGARAALKAGRRASVQRLLDGAFKWAISLDDSSEKAAILIHLAKSYEQLADTSKKHERHGYLKSYESLMAAYGVSKSQGEFRVRSFALGNLGRLYQKRNRLNEALYVTRVALNSAKTSNAPESVYRWLWQEGQILWTMGKRGPALRSYRRAVKILEDTRHESLAQYGSSSAHFHRVVSPVYMDLVDALVKTSTVFTDPAKTQMFLVEARNTLEKFRASELREYFQDECFGEFEYKTVNLEGISETAAVVYPILFADRVDLLVSFSGGIKRFSSRVGKREIDREIQKFRQYVEKGEEAYAGSSQKLYEWLIRPFEKDLQKADVDTLVFVPDGPLRSIPMSALNDGDEFLVQKFAVAVTPSLSMTQPQPLDRGNVRLLLAGLSEAVQDFSALDSVPQEVANIKSIFGGDLLMNKTFTVNNFGNALKAREMSIVHIASHGSFTGREKENFLLAYDGKIHMDKLRNLIGSTRTRENPIELLVLSACETAAGDDRAALGLAGVAIQAGARSAMGSLWKISDQGTTELIGEFYKQLKNPKLNKAQALQRAQKKLLASKQFKHPFFWSPFLMINNWL